jgi:hypothetical protein
MPGTKSLPMGWVEYLAENRDFSRPFGQARVPLCGQCSAERDGFHSSYSVSADGGEAPEDLAAFLDDLDLDAIVDEGLQ